MRDGRLLIGWGAASASYPAFHAPSSARVRLLADGTAEVEAAASDMGPETYTSMPQVAAETLGLPTEQVRFSLGRSDYPATPSRGGLWTMASVGSTIRAACLAALEHAGRTAERPVAAEASAVGRSRRTASQRTHGRLLDAREPRYSRTRSAFVDEVDPRVNPLGVKGLGEIALVGTTMSVLLRKIARYAAQKVASDRVMAEAKQVAQEDDRAYAAGRAFRGAFDKLQKQTIA